MVDIKRALTCAFDDPDWLDRVGLGTLISLVPILNLASLGYKVELSRRVMRGESRPLPTWDELGQKMVNGLLWFIALLIYQIPAAILMAGPLVFVVPAFLLAREQGAVAPILAILVWVLFGGLGLLVELAILFFYPAIYVQFVRRGEFGACFDWPAIWELVRRHTNPYFTVVLGCLLAWVIYMVGTSLAGSIAYAIPCLGWLVEIVVIGVGMFWWYTVIGHLGGQLAALVQGERVE